MDTKQVNQAARITKIVLNVIFYTLIALILLYSIVVITSRGASDIPNVFGNGFLAVETDSMVGDNEDSFNPNDLIFVKILKDDEKRNLQVGQVITFIDHSRQGRLNTHRIIEVRPDGVRTQGDNASGPDLFITSYDDIVAVYQGKIGGLGGFVLFLQTQLGFGLVVLLPIFLLLIYQGIVLFMHIYELKREKLLIEQKELQEKAKQELEAEKERIRQELLKELQEKNKDK